MSILTQAKSTGLDLSGIPVSGPSGRKLTQACLACRTGHTRLSSPFWACDEQQTQCHMWLLYTDDMNRFSQMCQKSLQLTEEGHHFAQRKVKRRSIKLAWHNKGPAMYSIWWRMWHCPRNVVIDDFSSWGTQLWTSLLEHWNSKWSQDLCEPDLSHPKLAASAQHLSDHWLPLSPTCRYRSPN